MEYSFGLLKPDCLQRGLTKNILAMIGAIGLEIAVVKILNLTKEDVEVLYEGCRNDHYFETHSQFMQSGPVLAFIVTGENAIGRLNELVGPTDSFKARAGTIRNMGTDICRNLIHSSESEADALREAKAIFGENEIAAIGII